MMDDNELKWNPLKEYKEYEISENGIIRTVEKYKEWIIVDDTVKTIKIQTYLKEYVDKKGYGSVSLCGALEHVHRLVQKEFGPENKENKKCVDHIDKNPRNNHFSNLRWATPEENSKNMSERNTKNKGVKYDKSNNKWIGYIRHLTTKNVVLKSFDPLKRIAAYLWINKKMKKYRHIITNFNYDPITCIGKTTSESIEELIENNNYPENCENMQVYFDNVNNKFIACRTNGEKKESKQFSVNKKEEAYVWAFKKYYKKTENKKLTENKPKRKNKTLHVEIKYMSI